MVVGGLTTPSPANLLVAFLISGVSVAVNVVDQFGQGHKIDMFGTRPLTDSKELYSSTGCYAEYNFGQSLTCMTFEEILHDSNCEDVLLQMEAKCLSQDLNGAISTEGGFIYSYSIEEMENILQLKKMYDELMSDGEKSKVEISVVLSSKACELGIMSTMNFNFFKTGLFA